MRHYRKIRCIQLRLICTLMILLLVWGSSNLTLRAELIWERQTVEITPDPKIDVVEAHFHFTNHGETPVDIQDIQTSCGCTTAALEQRHYGPGKGGEIVARYTVGEHVGLQTKTVVVSASDQQETTLTLVVHLPELLHIEPTSITWKHGERPATKTIRITASPDVLSFESVTVRASNTRVTTLLRPVVEGKQYELEITPDTTDQPALVTLSIHSRLGTKENTFRAYATVELPTPSPGMISSANGPRLGAPPPARPSPSPAH